MFLQSSVARVCKAGRLEPGAQRSALSRPLSPPSQVNNLIWHVRCLECSVCRTSLRQQNSCHTKNKEIFSRWTTSGRLRPQGQQCRRGSSEAVCQLRSVSGPEAPASLMPRRGAARGPSPPALRAKHQELPGRSSVAGRGSGR